MKKAIFIALLAIGFGLSAQNHLPNGPTDISPILVGEKIPNLILKSVDNVDVNILELIKKKKTVLVFYRGGWCPYCNAHLSALGEAEKELLDLGYQIIAVSPDSPKNLAKTIEKDKVNYLLLSDSKGELCRAIGIAFKMPFIYKIGLKKSTKGTDSSFIPVPSLFIVDTNGDIQFEHITPDFKHRITNNLLIAAAKSLN